MQDIVIDESELILAETIYFSGLLLKVSIDIKIVQLWP